MSNFFFIRHGETDWNKRGLWQGSTDTDLNETGRDQARSAIPKLEGIGITQLVCSPMKRCLQTAEIINEAFGLPLHHHEDLRERCFGKLNGKTLDEIGNLEDYDPEEYGIERREAVMQRAVTAIEDSLRHYPNEKILFVSHGGIFQVVHDHFCQEIKKTQNAIPYHFRKENQAWRADEIH